MAENKNTNQTQTIEEPETVETVETEETVETAPVDEVVDEILKGIEDDTLTPYKVHSVLNGVFATLDSDRTVRPQMMYNYDRNGLIVKGKKGTKSYTKDEVGAFIKKYVTKHLNK